MEKDSDEDEPGKKIRGHGWSADLDEDGLTGKEQPYTHSLDCYSPSCDLNNEDIFPFKLNQVVVPKGRTDAIITPIHNRLYEQISSYLNVNYY
ncbi:MAG: hypothetical protein EZS28_016378 [Streblomastix strix]|uniref:Uncharacterized protein n=1 Tax=Streblomastix strix TaxID=222440 RepID=A0A5J4VZU9_9EUKA|nr:MAG: hypothetical protein EZS28_016378 [Streblomastix strix]